MPASVPFAIPSKQREPCGQGELRYVRAGPRWLVRYEEGGERFGPALAVRPSSEAGEWEMAEDLVELFSDGVSEIYSPFHEGEAPTSYAFGAWANERLDALRRYGRERPARIEAAAKRQRARLDALALFLEGAPHPCATVVGCAPPATDAARAHAADLIGSLPDELRGLLAVCDGFEADVTLDDGRDGARRRVVLLPTAGWSRVDANVFEPHGQSRGRFVILGEVWTDDASAPELLALNLAEPVGLGGFEAGLVEPDDEDDEVFFSDRIHSLVMLLQQAVLRRRPGDLVWDDETEM